MSDETDIEKLKLEYADKQAQRDFWKWVIMGIATLVTPALHIATSYYEQQITRAAAQKADKAAKAAEVVAAETKEIGQTSLKTNVALNDWKAQYTKDPSDERHAEESRLKLEQHAAPNGKQ